MTDLVRRNHTSMAAIVAGASVVTGRATVTARNALTLMMREPEQPWVLIASVPAPVVPDDLR